MHHLYALNKLKIVVWMNTWNYYLAFVKNIVLLFVLFMLTRIVFVCYNAEFFQNISLNSWGLMLQGALRFDFSGILYVNLLYILLIFSPFPIKWRQGKLFQTSTRVIFTLFNGIALCINLIDTVYFPFSQRRTTWSIFNEFSHTDNLLEIFKISIFNNWYLFILALGIFPVLFYLYQSTQIKNPNSIKLRTYWIITLILFPLSIASTVLGIRGGIGRFVRPITISNANQYVNQPLESSFILNTPFTLIRTIENNSLPTFSYFKSQEEAEKIHPVLYRPSVTGKMKKLNVVVIIMESFAREYVGSLNKETIGADYAGYTPFLDSLVSKSLTFETSLANGRKSIDALPSILASIPRVGEPYFVGDYGNNKVLSIAGELKKKGYYSAFFHGAPNGSMGFWAFAKGSGFQDEYGMNEYGKSDDFDGTWAIWDEPFFQFYADKMNEFKEPFVTTIFSTSSHHPFAVPEKYNSLAAGTLPIHKCVRYSDIALKHFFEKASKMPWFKNTLFVLTADHTNQTDQPTYQNDIGSYSVPILFYYPAGITPEYRRDLAQQIDIKPSILGFLGYDMPYIAFGTDVFHRKDSTAFAVHDVEGIYSLYKNDYNLQFDGNKPTALYDFKQDRMQKTNLLEKNTTLSTKMEKQLKSILQNYQSRMKTNNLTAK